MNTLQANLRINGPLAVRSVDGSKTWVDPIVGVQLHTQDNGKRWHLQVYTEIGGFGAGSTFTWQIFPAAGVDLTKRASLEVGYRWLDIDYSAGRRSPGICWRTPNPSTDSGQIDPLRLRVGIGCVTSRRVLVEFHSFTQYTRPDGGPLAYTDNIFRLNFKIALSKGISLMRLLDGGVDY